MAETFYGSVSNSEAKDVVFGALSERPSAPSFSVGRCQIGKNVYTSDGVSWTPVNTLSGDFNPSQVPGLQLWLDASDAVFKADGTLAVLPTDSVAIWPDKSGNNRGPTVAGTPKVGVINGKQAIQFGSSVAGAGARFITPAFLSVAYATSGLTILMAAKHNTDTVPSTQVLTGCLSPNFWIEVGSPRNTGATTTGLTSFAPQTDRGTLSGIYSFGWSGTSAFYGINDVIGQDINGVGVSANTTILKTVGGSLAFSGNALTIGDLTGGGFTFDGCIGEYLVYNRRLTEAEIADVKGYLMTKWGFDKPLYVCVGDSITAGTGSTDGPNQSIVTGTSNYPNQLKALLGGESNVSVKTYATPGWTISGDIKPVASASRMYAVYNNDQTLKTKTAIIFVGTNDVATGAVGTGVYDYLVDLCNDVRNVGYKVVVVTFLPRQDAGISLTFEAARVSLNTKIKANYQLFADAIVKVDELPQLQDPTNTVYFNSDKVHLTDAGYAIVAAGIRKVL